MLYIGIGNYLQLQYRYFLEEFSVNESILTFQTLLYTVFAFYAQYG